MEIHEAYSSITYRPTYEVLSSGEVTATSMLVALGNDTKIEGDLTAVNALP